MGTARFPCFTLTLLIMAGCCDLPRESWERLQETRNRLRESEAALYAAAEMAQFESEFSCLQRAYYRERNQSLFLCDSGLPLQIAQQIDWARLLMEHIGRRREFLASRERDQLRDFGNRIREMEKRRLTPRMRTALTRTQLSLTLANRKWEEGKFLETARLIDDLFTYYGSLERLIDSARERYRDPVLLQLWSEWTRKTIQRSAKTGSSALVVLKRSRKALLYRDGVPVDEFPVDLGWNPYPDKLQINDGATPEGEYSVVQKKDRGETIYHRALLLDYPNSRDWKIFTRAKRMSQIPSGVGIGGTIEIHGRGGRGRDWTDGCVALDDSDMDKVFEVARVGMQVAIVGDLP